MKKLCKRERRVRGKGKPVTVIKVYRVENQVTITNVYVDGTVETLINPP